jgi:hypothetical protein
VSSTGIGSPPMLISEPNTSVIGRTAASRLPRVSDDDEHARLEAPRAQLLDLPDPVRVKGARIPISCVTSGFPSRLV